MASYITAARRAARSYEEMLPDVSDALAARVLGGVSLAIGLTELLAPRRLERLMGLDDDDGQTTGIFRALGVRECMHGVDLLSHDDDPAPGVYARCVGDGLDSVLLGAAMLKSRRKAGVAAVFALVLPVVVADLLFAGLLAARGRHRRS